MDEQEEKFERKSQVITSLPDVRDCTEAQRFYIKNPDGTYSEYIVLEGKFVNTKNFT